MTTYLVTGVSGALGSRLVSELSSAARTTSITGIDRRPLKTSASKLKYVQHDGEAQPVDDVVAGADVMIHLAPFEPAGLAALLQAGADARVESVVVLSSAAVFGAWPTNAVPLTEDSPLHPNPGFSFAVKMAENERLLQQFKRSHPDIAVAILRLAVVIGSGFEKALLDPLGISAHRHVESSRPLQFLHVDDAVSAIALAATRRLDGVYNVAPDGFVDEAKARAVAGAAPRPGLPRRVAYVANDLMWRSRKSLEFAAASLYLEYPWVMSNDKLRAAGWQPQYTTEETLVAESKPTLWGGMRPGQRRALVSGGVAAATSFAALGSLLATGEVIRRKRRKHSAGRVR